MPCIWWSFNGAIEFISLSEKVSVIVDTFQSSEEILWLQMSSSDLELPIVDRRHRWMQPFLFFNFVCVKFTVLRICGIGDHSDAFVT